VTYIVGYCDDCAQHYTSTPEEHAEVCEARICEQCLERGTGRVIEPNVYGLRLCWECQREDDAELLYSGSEDGEEEGEGGGWDGVTET
jgi:hypothetical protein